MNKSFYNITITASVIVLVVFAALIFRVKKEVREYKIKIASLPDVANKHFDSFNKELQIGRTVNDYLELKDPLLPSGAIKTKTTYESSGDPYTDISLKLIYIDTSFTAAVNSIISSEDKVSKRTVDIIPSVLIGRYFLRNWFRKRYTPSC